MFFLLIGLRLVASVEQGFKVFALFVNLKRFPKDAARRDLQIPQPHVVVFALYGHAPKDLARASWGY
jgi:hypothetical protein